jgi:hypothetical protein
MDMFNYVNATLSYRGMGIRTARVVENTSPVDERADLRALRRRARFEAWRDDVNTPDRVVVALNLQIAEMGLDDATEGLPTPRRHLEAELTVKRMEPKTVKRRADTPRPVERKKPRKQAHPQRIEQVASN